MLEGGIEAAENKFFNKRIKEEIIEEISLM